MTKNTSSVKTIFWNENKNTTSCKRQERIKTTGEIFFNADDIVKILGLGDNIKEFLGTDRGLDFINDFKRDHPGIDVFGNKGMIREVIKD